MIDLEHFRRHLIDEFPELQQSDFKVEKFLEYYSRKYSDIAGTEIEFDKNDIDIEDFDLSLDSLTISIGGKRVVLR